LGSERWTKINTSFNAKVITTTNNAARTHNAIRKSRFMVRGIRALGRIMTSRIFEGRSASEWWARRQERLCPPHDSAELFQHLSHALVPVICPTGQILVSRRDGE